MYSSRTFLFFFFFSFYFLHIPFPLSVSSFLYLNFLTYIQAHSSLSPPHGIVQADVSLSIHKFTLKGDLLCVIDTGGPADQSDVSLNLSVTASLLMGCIFDGEGCSVQVDPMASSCLSAATVFMPLNMLHFWTQKISGWWYAGKMTHHSSET